MSMGYFESQESAVPGAFDMNDPGQPQPSKKGRVNAATVAYNRAMAVQERTANRLVIGSFTCDASGDPIQVIGRQPGRKFLILRVPSTATIGILIAHRQEEIIGGINSWLVSPSDPPLYIPAEASVFAASPTPGTAALGQYIAGFAVDSDQDQ